MPRAFFASRFVLTWAVLAVLLHGMVLWFLFHLHITNSPESEPLSKPLYVTEIKLIAPQALPVGNPKILPAPPPPLLAKNEVMPKNDARAPILPINPILPLPVLTTPPVLPKVDAPSVTTVPASTTLPAAQHEAPVPITAPVATLAVALAGAATANLPRTSVKIDGNYASNPKPIYPRMAQRNGEQGTVTVRVLVTAQGSAEQVELLRSSGFALLDQSALQTIAKWRFTPATLDGKPVAQWYTVPWVFKLDE